MEQQFREVLKLANPKHMIPWIVANVIIGSRPEPFFSACLESVEQGIDFLVLNDNSGDPSNPNLNVFYESKLYREGRALLLQTKLSELSGFDEARNLCLKATAEKFSNRNLWILYLDSDEVHSNHFERLTRRFLAQLSPRVGVVDGYFYQFIQSFKYYSSIDRRHNLLFRYNPQLRWEKPIHSELKGIQGIRVPTGYLYFHYGYVYSPENVLRRWRLYKEYDSIPYDPETIDPNTLFFGYEKKLVRFEGMHPEPIRRDFLKKNLEAHVARFTAHMDAYFAKHPFHRLQAKARQLNWKLRLGYRNFQAFTARWLP
jgi:hypothetical protein